MNDAKEEIKSRLAVEDVVGQYVELKRAGRNLKGHSPWGVDKTPSFMVSPEKGIWHDFSANKGGDIFTFVMEVEGISFKEAMEKLAGQAGVDLTKYRGGDPAVAKKVASYAAYGTDGFSFAGNLVGWVDRQILPGKMHELVFDPEGILSSIPAVATAMLGVFSGELLRRTDVSGNRKTLVLLGAGLVCTVACLVWEPWCPINKKIWTSTFVLAAGAYSFAVLALFYWIVDVKGWRRWTFFFRVIGMNAITIYLLMRFVQFRAISKFFFSGVAGLGNGDWPNVALIAGQIAVEWLVLLYMYRKDTFLRV